MTREIILLLQRTHAFAHNTSARKITKLAKMEKATKLFWRKVLFQLFSNGLVKNDLGVLLWAKESVEVKISRCHTRNGNKRAAHIAKENKLLSTGIAVISPTSDFANVSFANVFGCFANVFGCFANVFGCFANVFGCFANAMTRFAIVLLVTSPTSYWSLRQRQISSNNLVIT